MPKIDRNYEIDQQGKLILQNTLATFCILNEFHNDFGVDYHADVLSGYSLSGESFLVQLKSHEKILVHKDGSICETIDWNHLNNWNEKALPLFLCSVDIFAKKIYWTWIQEYLEKIVPTKKQKTHSVRIPVSNEIADNLPAFTAAVQNAIERSRSLAVAEKYSVRKQKTLYPYFDFTLDYIGGHEIKRITNTPPYQMQFSFDEKKRIFNLGHIQSTPFHLGFSFPSDLHQQKFFRGEAVECNVTETSCTDLVLPTQQYTAKLSNIKHNTDASLIIRNNKGHEIHRMDGFTGEYSHFNKHYGFKFTHPSKMITFDMFDNQTKCDFLYTYWDEYFVTDIPYLDLMSAFFKASEQQYSAELSINCDNQCVPVTFGEIPTSCDFIKNRICCLSMARQVFRELNVNFKVKDFFHDLDVAKNKADILCILGSLWEKTWKKKISNQLDMAMYFMYKRQVEAFEDNSLNFVVSEEIDFFRWRIGITTAVKITEMKPAPNGIYLFPTSSSEAIHTIKDIHVIHAL